MLHSMCFASLLIALAVAPFCAALIDPISLTGGAVVGIGAGLGWWKNDVLVDYTYCQVFECCRKPYLKSDIAALKRYLKESLYGQHIVEDVLVNAIAAHYENTEKSRKPLVMSFHGTSGTGKNYVSEFVAKALFKKGLDSNFVRKFTAGATSEDVAAIVKQTVKNCAHSLFIFDEIEKTKQGLFDPIVSLLDHHSSLKGYDFTKAIFIFLTNSAGFEIAEKLKSLMDAGKFRDQTTLKDFERIAELGAYNEDGGLYRSTVIKSNVIDHFVPFLPLQRVHVEMCIKRELALHDCPPASKNEDTRKIFNDVVTFDDTKTFSNNGCKRLSKKVESYCHQLRSINKQ